MKVIKRIRIPVVDLNDGDVIYGAYRGEVGGSWSNPLRVVRMVDGSFHLFDSKGRDCGVAQPMTFPPGVVLDVERA